MCGGWKQIRSYRDVTTEGNAGAHLEFTPREAAVASFIGETKKGLLSLCGVHPK